jgi:2-dehydropantoate 2-reductase
MKQTKILIAGIGGVGGYFGGLLAKEYESSTEVEICFLARGKNLEQIKLNGLVIKEQTKEFVAKPSVVSDNTQDFGKVDVVLVCTKTYDLEETINQLLPAITDNTILIPLQNGVNSRERISKLLPNNVITEGCAYIVSMIEEPGVVRLKSDSHWLSFGRKEISKELEFVQELFLKAKINSKLSADIETITWEKYVFISSIASATTYFNANIGTIISDENQLEILTSLIDEVAQLANVKNITLRDDIKENILKKLSTLPFESTTSTHRDFIAKKAKTELDSITGYVIEEAKKEGLKVPTFELVKQGIEEKYF